MDEQPIPSIGQWYIDREGRELEVVAIDETKGAVEVQFFDGAVAEYDLESWPEVVVDPIEPPEDWSGPFDDLVADDLGDTEEPMHPEDWDGPWNELDRED
ncbi:MAG: DUF6763 family protein [Gammaproteobacteria bacterium]|nr:DUF6763 family protein [Gammaproteobacteria bacterium]